MSRRDYNHRPRPIPAACPSGKRSYTGRRLAVLAGRAAQGNYDDRGPFDVYRCGDCRQYHLTTRRR